MGSVVGGLYASGYTATQIDSIFQSTNFDELISDFIPRSSKTFMKKEMMNCMHLFCHSIILKEYQKHFLKGCIILIY
jgi:predicted acylesterase/phospholipase RssA